MLDQDALGDRGLIFVTLAFFVPLAAVALTFLGREETADDGLRLACLIQVVAWGWVLGSWYLAHHRWLDPYTIVASALFLFNGGGASLVVVFGGDVSAFLNPEHFGGYEPFSRQSVLSAMLLVIACLVCCHIGALFGTIGHRHSARRVDKYVLNGQDVAMRQIGWWLIAVSAVPAAYTIWWSAETVAQGGYMALFQNPLGASQRDYNYFVMLSSGLVPGALIILATGGGRWCSTTLSWGIVGLVSASFLAMGTRAAAFQNAVSILWLHHHCVRRIKVTRLAILAPLAAFVATLVRWARSCAGDGLITMDSLRDAMQKSSFAPVQFLNEMGSSIITVVYTIDLIPAERPHGWGESYFYSLLAAVPNLFWDTHPTIANGSVGRWLIETVSPATAAAGGGLGYSLIAEAYYNFSWFGAALFMGLFGLCLGRFAGWVHEEVGAYRLALAGIVVSILMFASRGDSQTCVRRLLWLCVVPALLSRVLQVWHERHSTRKMIAAFRVGRW